MATASSFVPVGVSFPSLSLWHGSEISKYLSRAYAPGIFSNCCFYAVSLQVLCYVVSLRIKTQLPIILQALPELELTDF